MLQCSNLTSNGKQNGQHALSLANTLHCLIAAEKDLLLLLLLLSSGSLTEHVIHNAITHGKECR
jgi:hypothetical protein